MADLPTEAQALAIRAAVECKALRTLINGNAETLAALDTTTKTSLVAAVNELVASVAAISTPAWVANITSMTITAGELVIVISGTTYKIPAFQQ